MARGRMIEAIARVNATRRPEHDVRLRALVLGTVVVAVLAVAVAGAAHPVEALLVAALLPLGFLWSHQRRARSNGVAKIVISIGAVLALLRFFADRSGISTVDDARAPLT